MPFQLTAEDIEALQKGIAPSVLVNRRPNPDPKRWDRCPCVRLGLEFKKYKDDLTAQDLADLRMSLSEIVQRDTTSIYSMDPKYIAWGTTAISMANRTAQINLKSKGRIPLPAVGNLKEGPQMRVITNLEYKLQFDVHVEGPIIMKEK